MNQRRIWAMGITVLVFLLLSAAVLSAGGGQEQAGAVTINYWAGFTGPDKLGMQAIVEDFEGANPKVDVEFMTAPWTEVFTKFNATFGSSSAPNLMVMHISDIPQFADRKMLNAVGGLLSTMGVKESDYPTPVWQGQFYGGSQGHSLGNVLTSDRLVGEKRDRGSQPFSAGANDVGAGSGKQLDVAVERLPKRALYQVQLIGGDHVNLKGSDTRASLSA